MDFGQLTRGIQQAAQDCHRERIIHDHTNCFNEDKYIEITVAETEKGFVSYDSTYFIGILRRIQGYLITGATVSIIRWVETGQAPKETQAHL